MLSSNKKMKVSLILLTFFLSACGGSSGGSVAKITPPLATNNGLSYVAGVFTDDKELAGLCTGETGGSALAEKLWLRSWSDNTYLWYDEINDQDPNAFTVADYFEELKTTALAPSGKFKDQYHFLMSSQEWQLFTQSGASVGFGANFSVQQKDDLLGIPRKITITFSDPDSPAANKNITRGAVIVAVDGINVETASDDSSIATLNNGLFPSTEGQAVIWTLRDLGENVTREVTLVSETGSITPVQQVKTVETTMGKVGYVQFNAHIATAEKGLYDAFITLQAEQITDLVLDVRYNRGGLLALASQVAYMIAGEASNNKIFEELAFNEKHLTVDPVSGEVLQPLPFIDTTIGFDEETLAANLSLPTLGLTRVFVLTSADTCSASEAIINGLRGIDIDVIQIGGTTCGKPYGFYPTPNCGTTYFTVQFKGENQKGYGDYSDGFVPAQSPNYDNEVQGCVVADDFNHMLGDSNEAMFAAALVYSDSDEAVCPAESALKAAKGILRQGYIDPKTVIKDTRAQSLLRGNRIIM